MIKRKLKHILTPIALIAVMVVIAASAAGNYGSESDPLVTLSYLNDVVTPALKAEAKDTLDAKLAELEAQLDGHTGGSGSSVFEVVSVSAGQRVRCSAGAEIIARVGSVVCAADSSPGLVDSTDGKTIDNGSALTKNHLYAVTIEGNGFRASDSAKVLIRGGYTIE
ncbi:MAG: hypothetical protein LBD85_03810 [Oscillospiraceae bacterium]|jgi:hypothetical protein|nr:hypothetical protein [Oscillospiraceae bacterium]